MKNKKKMDVEMCVKKIMEQYALEDIKEFKQVLNSSILKKELFDLILYAIYRNSKEYILILGERICIMDSNKPDMSSVVLKPCGTSITTV